MIQNRALCYGKVLSYVKKYKKGGLKVNEQNKNIETSKPRFYDVDDFIFQNEEPYVSEK